MSKKYYVERKADNVWMVAAEDGSDAQEFNDQGRATRHCIAMNAPVQLQAAIDFVLGDASPDETLDDELKFAADRLYNLRIFDRETIAKASRLALYADHVTTELQTENEQLRAKVAELGAVQVGTIEKPFFMPLHREIGKADNGVTELVVCVGATANSPMIKHPDGRLWSLDWKAMIELAVKAFAKEGDQS